MNKKLAAARLSIAAIVIYHVLLTALIFIRPDLDPYWHTISEWALGPYGWIMTAAFLSSAIAYAALLIAIRGELKGLVGKTGLVIFVICILGLVGVGLFVTDPMDGLGSQAPETISTRGIVHIVCGSAQLMLLPVAAVLINLSLALRNERWIAVRRSLILTGFLPLLGIAGFIVHMSLYVIPMGEWAHGPDVPVGWPPRFLFLTYAVWLVTLALNYIRIGAK